MTANINDKLQKAAIDWTGAVGSGGVTDAIVTTIPLVSSTGLATDTAVQITIDRVDANGTSTPAKKEVIKGVVSSNNLIDCVRGVEGTAQAHSAGAVVEVMLTATQFNDEIDHNLVDHNQDGTHKVAAVSVPTHAATSKTTPVDADEIGLIDSAASNALKKLTWANLKATLKTYFDTLYKVAGLTAYSNLNLAEGQMINGKIVPSVASNNLTVALKTLAGTDPSATDPVYCRIGDTVRTITAALSHTMNAGTNYNNAGSAELATKEIDWFTFLCWSTADSAVHIGISRWPTDGTIPTAGSTNEKGCNINGSANSGDVVEVVGRFAATLSAGAGYTWSVPTFTAINLIQRPIYETRFLDFSPNRAVAAGTVPTYAVSDTSKYKIVGNRCSIELNWINSSGGTAGSGTNSLSFNLPITPGITFTANRSDIGGTFNVFEATGTKVVTTLLNLSSAISVSFYSTTSVTGADQSDADRFIGGTCTYRI